MEFEPVIGLEVHIQLNTKSKIFCGCSTRFGSDSNTQTCPVCLGLPGVLPVLNKEALEKVVLAGLSLHCTISKYSKFDRKNYFYPDLPKSYQISQYDKPICYDGYVEITTEGGYKKIGITRLHLEEDAGKNIHSEIPAKQLSYVDFNRTGVPLGEIVSEPDISSSDEAYQYLQNLKSIMRYIDVSDCNMEEGSLRCDVNISLRKKGSKKFGDKVEIKNLNSFKAVKMALEFEIQRQERLLREGDRIQQETRLWDAERNETIGMRSKEEAPDYRYFPEPDLAPITLDDSFIAALRSSLPELPAEKKRRFVAEFKIPEYDAEILTDSRELADYFEDVVSRGINPKKASNWIMSESLALVARTEDIKSSLATPEKLAKLLSLIENKTISGKIAKKVFAEMAESGADPVDIVKKKGLEQVTDSSAIEEMIDRIIGEHQQSVEDYKNGKDKALGFLVGQVMKESRGKANPQMVNELLLKRLKS